MKVVVNTAVRYCETWNDIQSYFDEIGKSNIRSLCLSDNNLFEIPPGIFSGLPSLQRLNLENNNLYEILPGTFSGLSSLRRLRLQHNNLSEIPPETFTGLSSLQKLSLQCNQLFKITPGTFEGLTSLQELWLNNNQISEMHPSSFSGLSSLQVLWLSTNKIFEIPPETFTGLSSLQRLLLRYNHLSRVPDGIRDGCKIFFFPQRKHPITLIKEHRQLSGEEVSCSISYEPIVDGCEYRMCSNPIKQHYVLSEYWSEWEKTCRNSKCVVCKEYDIVPKIFINN
jgi:Leucine-rich repeat (LRR) protein